MVVSEDSATKAFDTLKNLLLLISNKENLTVSKVIDAPSELKVLARANAWLSKKQHTVDTLRLIANELDNETKFLVWHIDGDCKFSEYNESKGNVAKFKSLITDLPEELPVRRGKGFVPVFTDNIITMIPCYSVLLQ